MKSLLAIICGCLVCSSSLASLSTCTDLYVGKIRLTASNGLERFTLVENPEGTNASSGGWSNWIMVNSADWSTDEKKEVLSVLMAAKAAGQKLTIQTKDASNCGISSSSQELLMIEVQSVQE